MNRAIDMALGREVDHAGGVIAHHLPNRFTVGDVAFDETITRILVKVR